MITVIKGKVLDVDSQPYEVDGKKGISNKVIVKEDNGTIRKITIPQENVSEYKQLEGSYQEIPCDVFIPNGVKVNFKLSVQ